ncbi:TIGR03013 family XrtA/PEP-CTERM system glycosyltransferase [uncultured Desulfobacter sp.]|uniref:TIGR03013 family XrtA/PEP-CTERM system glycosyltransferase n=1 Tax=uncultured Desulfobacter sp. TaxID=240139 RepID=UPI0029F540A7|nr:TIGR03013 family XrtA/PEP-CTERM system glycosyltransferase [uncultured Desulfobacter sp.]
MIRILRHYFPIRNMLFSLFEGCIIFGCFLFSTRLLTSSASFFFDLMLVLRIALITIICQISLYYNDLYDFERVSKMPEMATRLLQALGITSIALACIYFIFPLAILDQKAYILSIFFLMIFIIFWRICYIEILNRGIFNERIIILGSNNFAKDIYKKICSTIDCGYTVSGVIPDNDTPNLPKGIPADLVLPREGARICELAELKNIDKIVVALKEKRGCFPIQELIQCRTEGVDVVEGSSFYEMLTGKVLVRQINPSWLIFSHGFRKSRAKEILKRVEDIVFSFSMLTLLSPLLLLVATLIKLDSKGPVLFAQDRVGKDKQEYMMHKFRSMVADAEKKTGPVWAGDNDPRITRIGRIIRKYRIDELPQLWEVLTGKMSFVGPRPERKYFTDQLEKEIPFYDQRFNVKPGLTGWAQVCYDYGATVEDAVEKLNYELFYIKNMSLALDIVIILKTVKTVLFGRGAR